MKLSDMHRPELEPVELPKSGVWPRLLILAGAIVITIVVFVFWGRFADAYIHVLEMPPSAAQPSGPVTVDIIPTKKKVP
jgi:hypothetical protein